ncbi:MAG: hypothetical protein M0Z53_10245 [Thermaerobacter sp.]|nr:hypothetical protein [Thermaerobacter sp.]
MVGYTSAVCMIRRVLGPGATKRLLGGDPMLDLEMVVLMVATMLGMVLLIHYLERL